MAVGTGTVANRVPARSSDLPSPGQRPSAWAHAERGRTAAVGKTLDSR
jgi:hypothetical protein